jgi:hypothetical protein
MDMTDYWVRYIRRERTRMDEASFKQEMLKELDFQEFIDPVRSEEFYAYLNRILSSFAYYAKNKAVDSYRLGLKCGKIGTLSNEQRMMLKNEKYSDINNAYAKFVEEGSTEGPSSGDLHGFDDSFVDEEGIDASKEFNEIYGNTTI